MLVLCFFSGWKDEMIIISVSDLSERQGNYGKIQGKWFKRANCFPLSQYDVAIKECQLKLESSNSELWIVVKEASEVSLWSETQENLEDHKQEDHKRTSSTFKRYRGNIYENSEDRKQEDHKRTSSTFKRYRGNIY